MIHPEFLDDLGELIMDLETQVPESGTARMWIFDDEMRPYHQKRIVVGTTGYMQEGGKKAAKCKVVEIAGLMSNPTARIE
ncbi:MAG: hypothetical protein JKY18_13770 [Flavobacteriales bacterium]|nr:hypothetical protein [Flavobacteriales bacterium]